MLKKEILVFNLSYKIEKIKSYKISFLLVCEMDV